MRQQMEKDVEHCGASVRPDVNANVNANAASGSHRGSIGVNVNANAITRNFDASLIWRKKDMLYSQSYTAYRVYGMLV